MAMKNVTDKIIRLNDLVEYQDKAVVSRIVLSGDTGSLSVFSFDNGQELKEHRSPFEAFIHILEGEAEITLSGKTHHLKKDDQIIMQANAPHAVKSITRFKMSLTLFKPKK